jgi:hypothetical protein
MEAQELVKGHRAAALGFSRPLRWLESEELSPSLGVEGAFDHADVEGGIFNR